MKLFKKIAQKFNDFNVKIFDTKLGLYPLFIRLYVLDYKIKSKRFNDFINPIKRKLGLEESSIYAVTRGALINMNLFCLFMVFKAFEMQTDSFILNLLFHITFILCMFSLYINFCVVKNIKFEYLIRYADFTQIIGLNTAINTGNALYKLSELDKQTLKMKVDVSEKMWIEKIDNSDNFNNKLIFIHPLIIVPFYIVLLLLPLILF